MKGQADGWQIRKMDNAGVAEALRDPLACEAALDVAVTEALARLLEAQPPRSQAPAPENDCKN